MQYIEFAEKFLAAIYYETEQKGGNYFNAGRIIQDYNLEGKDHWISRLADDWEHFYFSEISKVLGGYEQWSFRISGQGARYIEEQYPEEDKLKKFLGINEAEDISSISAKLAPAADRYVNLEHNSASKQEIVDGIQKIEKEIQSSNALEEDEKSETILSLTLARRLFEKSKQVLVGAFRYLVVERIKKALERTIEDALRASIIAILIAIIPIIMVAL